MMDIQEAMTYLGFGRKKIMRLIRQKLVRVHREPVDTGPYMFRQEWLDEYVERFAPVVKTTTKVTTTPATKKVKGPINTNESGSSLRGAQHL